jgi:hypothetical protein
MKVLPVILDSYERNKILKHLKKINKVPPGVDEIDITNLFDFDITFWHLPKKGGTIFQ